MQMGRSSNSMLALCLYALLPNPSRAEDAVLTWNAAVLRALKQDASAPLLVARALAILHVAQWRTVGGEKKADELAVASAGYTVAITLLPGHRGEFDALWTKQLGEDSGKRLVSIQKGEAAAREVLADR